LEELPVDLVQTFLESVTNGSKPQTRKMRFAHLTSFFNFSHDNLSPDFQNPCNSQMLRKLFRPKITTNMTDGLKALVRGDIGYRFCGSGVQRLFGSFDSTKGEIG
jgi:hypothetical protein